MTIRTHVHTRANAFLAPEKNDYNTRPTNLHATADFNLPFCFSLSLARGADFLSAELQKRKNFLAGCMLFFFQCLRERRLRAR